MKKKTKILFVCKNNRFRSKIAEAYLKKINKNVIVSSAGLFEGFPMNKETVKIVKELGITLTGKPRSISNKLLTEQDMIIIVANNVPKKVFNKKYCKKVILWKIPDVTRITKKGIEKTVKTIKKKINKLNETFDKIK